MRDWLQTIKAVDDLVGESIAAGLYKLRHEQHLVVVDTFDDPRECLETVQGWRGTRVPPELTQPLLAARAPVTVHQDVRLRLLGRRD